ARLLGIDVRPDDERQLHDQCWTELLCDGAVDDRPAADWLWIPAVVVRLPRKPVDRVELVGRRAHRSRRMAIVVPLDHFHGWAQRTGRRRDFSRPVAWRSDVRQQNESGTRTARPPFGGHWRRALSIH